MSVRLTPEGLSELRAILVSIRRASPRGAARVLKRFDELLGILDEQPRAGKKAKGRDIYRVVLRPFPCLVFYRLIDDAVQIFIVRHAARDPRTMPGSEE